MSTGLTIPRWIIALILALSSSHVTQAAGGFSLFGSLYVGTYDTLRLTYEKQIGACIWSDEGETLYRVSVVGLHDSESTYRLENDFGDHVHYEVFWSDLASSIGREQLLPGTVSVDAYPIDSTIDGDNSANTYLTVVVLKTGLNGIDAAPAAVYTDVLTVQVDPE